MSPPGWSADPRRDPDKAAPAPLAVAEITTAPLAELRAALLRDHRGITLILVGTHSDLRASNVRFCRGWAGVQPQGLVS